MKKTLLALAIAASTTGLASAQDMPVAIGPYSHAVRAGDFVFISGQPGIDPSTGFVPAGGFQLDQGGGGSGPGRCNSTTKTPIPAPTAAPSRR